MPSHEISILIADDEAPARKRLKSLLADNIQFKIVAEAQNGDEVLRMIIEKSPQIAFLDINMPGASVFSTIPSLKNPPLVVFQTAYSEYGVQAFDINAIDYLLKPISKERFNQALEKLMLILNRDPTTDTVHSKETVKDVLSVKSGETIRILKIEKISRFSFEDGFSFIHSLKEKIYSDKSLNYYEELLEDKGFYRISRTDIINLQYMSKLHPMFNGQYIVEMISGDKIPISRRRIQGLKDIIN
ncbi:MAG: LytTR family DNA-binding domain-containing protein [Spirochaetaceae bacterium]|jgi:DNA-binding LytR/AlgR family response regulator|nr:LytTR family DNA-binding domain-containing protein [Spirochaetaceae bacterium]